MLTKCEEDTQRRGFEKFSGYFCEEVMMDKGLGAGICQSEHGYQARPQHRGDISHWPQILNVNSRRLS